MAEYIKSVSGVLHAQSPNIPTVAAATKNVLGKRRHDDRSREPDAESQQTPSGSGVFIEINDEPQSNEENSRDEFVTAEMIAVEEKLRKQLEKDQLRRLRITEAQANAVSEEELTKSRHNRLMHLLSQSAFYSKFMKEKLEANKKAKSMPKPSRPGRKKAPAPAAAPRPHRRLKHTDEYDITAIVNSLDSDQDEDDEEVAPAAVDDQPAAATYVNSMGFTVPALQPPLFEGGAMRDYQVDGLEWLKILDSNSVSGILGDEMGLGKTIQVIALIAHLVGTKTVGPFLIIAPLSTIPNWMSEFQRFAPQIPVLLLHGSQDVRRKVIAKFATTHDVRGAKVRPIVITSFQIPMVEKQFFASKKWRYVIVDEGHRLKNHNTQLATQLRSFNSVNRLILTGTPLQNNLTELWSLLNFLLPEIFNDLSTFESWFDCKGLLAKGAEDRVLAKEEEHSILSTLHQILSPFLLRRTKADVSLDLPPKKELLVFCPLTVLQQQLYSAVLDKSIEKLQRRNEELTRETYDCRPKRLCVARREGRSYADASADTDDVENWPEIHREQLEVVTVTDEKDPNYRFHIKMQMPEMVLRHVVNHPYLVQLPLSPETGQPRIDEDLVTNSGKMLVLDAMLAKLKLGGHKVLLFSGFTMMLDLIADFLELRDYRYCSLDGRMSLEDRQMQIRKFNSEPDVFIFLVSTRAGGLGINLTAADTVITYDSDWNPQADLQAQDRCHRIGQTRPVVVYRFITKGTIDQVIIERASAKRKLERMIIQPGAFKMAVKAGTKTAPVDLVALRLLLKDSPFTGEMHSNGFVFNEAELDSLLDRSDMLEEMRVMKEERRLAKMAADGETPSTSNKAALESD